MKMMAESAVKKIDRELELGDHRHRERKIFLNQTELIYEELDDEEEDDDSDDLDVN